MQSYISTPTQQVRNERERQLANTSLDTPTHSVISKEHRIKTKHHFTTAMLQRSSNGFYEIPIEPPVSLQASTLAYVSSLYANAS